MCRDLRNLASSVLNLLESDLLSGLLLQKSNPFFLLKRLVLKPQSLFSNCLKFNSTPCIVVDLLMNCAGVCKSCIVGGLAVSVFESGC